MRKAATRLVTACMVLLMYGCDDEQISYRLIQFNTVKAGSVPGNNRTLQPGIIVRVASTGTMGEGFVLSNEAGIGLMPLTAGNYCLDVYDTKGWALPLDSKQHTGQPSCFSVRKNQLDVEDEIGVAFTGTQNDSRISLGFAHIVAKKAAIRPGDARGNHPSVIVRVAARDGRKAESLLLSAGEGTGDGIGLVPFRPGKYCFYAYDRRGRALRLDLEKQPCFEIRENETSQVEVVIHSD